jgi:SAM-dependent methyltransferase
MKQGALDLLACPSCRGELRIEDPVSSGAEVRAGTLRCVGCEATYSIESGAARLMPADAPAERWDEWEEKQELGLREYQEEQVSGANGAVDPVATEFGVFSGLNGTILDIGCGIAATPPYATRSSDDLYIGVDPLYRPVERTFEFVEGVGERLPFQAGVFDCAVSATSLDHFAAPELVLGEIRRVLKPGGRFALWIGVLDEGYFERMYALPSLRDREARQVLIERVQGGAFGEVAAMAWRHLVANRIRQAILRLRRLMRRPLPVGEVFADRGRYHFHFYTEPEVYELLERSGFRAIRQRLLEDGSRGNSLFVLASPAEGGAD